MADENMPITGVCIVDQVCPPGYTMIDKCEDSRTEADLWKDTIFARKVKRFICFTKTFPLSGGALNNVLVDICIHEEKEPAPTGFSTISLTTDTTEPALKKKQISFQMVARNQATEAINDIHFLSKQKRPALGYTLVGELNGLLLCYRTGPVPQTTPPPIPLRPQQVQQQQYMPYAVTPVQVAPLQGHGDNIYGNAASFTTAPQRQESQPRVHPLSGVPFEVNPKLTASTSHQVDIGEFKFRSRENIMHQFDYPFFVEKQAMQTSQHYNGMG